MQNHVICFGKINETDKQRWIPFSCSLQHDSKVSDLLTCISFGSKSNLFLNNFALKFILHCSQDNLQQNFTVMRNQRNWSIVVNPSFQGEVYTVNTCNCDNLLAMLQTPIPLHKFNAAWSIPFPHHTSCSMITVYCLVIFGLTLLILYARSHLSGVGWFISLYVDPNVVFCIVVQLFTIFNIVSLLY